MNRRWICNASPIIVLSKIGRIALLPALADTLIIPGAVADEIDAGAGDDPARVWLRGPGQPYIQRPDPPSPLVQAWDLGPGETSVLSWAQAHPGYEVLIDDRAARTCAQSLQLSVRGTIGVLLLAKKSGHVDRVEPLLRQVVQAGLRISQGVMETALRLSGEGPAQGS